MRRGVVSFTAKRMASKVLVPAALISRQYSLCDRQSCKQRKTREWEDGIR
jgi:hypothetical protein